jgi:hypothetical protein
VSIIKSVPNLIFYLHIFFCNFSQFLAICFELFSFGVNFNSEITDERTPPVRRRTPRVPTHCLASHAPPPSRQYPHAARPTASPVAPASRPSRLPDSVRPDRRGPKPRRPDCLTARPSPLCRAVVPALVSRSSLGRARTVHMGRA